jgi:hypothetical protein
MRPLLFKGWDIKHPWFSGTALGYINCFMFLAFQAMAVWFAAGPVHYNQ